VGAAEGFPSAIVEVLRLLVDITDRRITPVDLVIWLAVVITILGLGMGSMVWAYRRPLGNSALFPTPVVDLSTPVAAANRTQFEAGCAAFARGRYSSALDQFTAVMTAEPDCAEAFHNGGLVYANLGNDGLAVQALLKASDLYDRQDTKARLDLVKQQLEQIAGRRGLKSRTAA
jgi:tetratricopeptide (TPR) repeat protein